MVKLTNCKLCKKSLKINPKARCQRFCSKKCREKHWNIENKDYVRKWHYKYFINNRPDKFCLTCNKKLINRRNVRCPKICQKVFRKSIYRSFRRKLQQKLYSYKTKFGCTNCGYNRFGGALDFHHKDPTKKERRILAIDWAHRHKRPLIMKELRKCIILCANCHREETFNFKKELT